jgi:putative ABC transport system permease protein
MLIFLSAFTAFAVLAAGLILANTVAGQVLSQQRDIGLLKAVGMTPGGVTRLLVVQYLVVGLLGGVVGVGAGALVAPILVGRGARLLQTSAEPVIDPTMWAAVLVGVLLTVLVFSVLPAMRAGRTSTLSAIAPDRRDGPRFARLGGGQAAPAPSSNDRAQDAFARPARSWLTIGALTLAAATAVAALTSEATLNRMASDPRVVGERTMNCLSNAATTQSGSGFVKTRRALPCPTKSSPRCSTPTTRWKPGASPRGTGPD